MLCAVTAFGLVAAPVRVGAQLSGIKSSSAAAIGSIEGRLIAPPASGRSTERVSVLVYETGATTMVDHNGRYLIQGVPAGTYTLIVVGEGFSRLKIVDVVVRPDTRCNLGTEELPVVMREGEVQLLETVVVNATKPLNTLDPVTIIGVRPPPFSGADTDLPRTVDDPQPYYLFDRSAIEHSGAATMDDFARAYLPMNRTAIRSNEALIGGNSAVGIGETKSSITVGAFQPEQTLILINGRRVPLVTHGLSASPEQHDINLIPLAAVDRIEVLPASASAIYGGDAVGGVVNVVLRQDLEGAEIELGYQNVFHGDAPIRRASLVAGHSFERGRSHVMVILAQSESEPLRYEARAGLLNGYRDRALAGNPRGPEAALDWSPLGSTPNVIGLPMTTVVDGKLVQVPGALFGPGTADRTFVPIGYNGGGGIEAFRPNAGTLNLTPAGTAAGIGAFYDQKFPLTRGIRIRSAQVNFRRTMSQNLEVFLETAVSENKGTALNEPGVFDVVLKRSNSLNPFGVDIRVIGQLRSGLDFSTRTHRTDRLVAGFKLQLPREWIALGDVTHGELLTIDRGGVFDPNPLQRDFQAGKVDLLRDLLAHPLQVAPYEAVPYASDRSVSDIFSLRTAGPLGHLAGGRIRAAAGFGFDREKTGESVYQLRWLTPRTNTMLAQPSFAESRRNGYVELNIPIVGSANAVEGIRQLDLQAAARYDAVELRNVDHNGGNADYESPNFVFGVAYRPVAGLMFRGSYSSGFQAPTLDQILPLTPPLLGLPFSPDGWFPLFVADPKRGGEMPPSATSSLGGNPNVGPEMSRTLSVGVVFEPIGIPGFRLAVDRVVTSHRHEISQLAPSVILADEEHYPDRVRRAPLLPGDPYSVGQLLFVDGTAINLYRAESESYNVSFGYEWMRPTGSQWHVFGLVNSWQHYRRQSTPNGPLVEQVNTDDLFGLGQPKTTATAGVNWSRRKWSAGWMMRFVGSHRISKDYREAQGSDFVASQHYHDVYLGYSFSGSLFGLKADGLSLQVGIRNLLDKAPPFDAQNPNGYYNRFGELRGASYDFTVRKRW